MRNNTRVHIVIPVFNGWEQTEICLQALRASSVHQCVQIIVVDHGSTDATRDALRIHYPEVVLLLGDPALWWTGATNLGIRWAMEHEATMIMLLNNDCYLAPEAVERLLIHAASSGPAVIAPLQRDSVTHRVLYDRVGSCFLLGFPTLRLPRLSTAGVREQPLFPTRLIIGGRGVLMPVQVLERVGLFDEAGLPHYGADHDFYLRCRKQGIPLFTARDSVVYVDGRKTTLARRIGAMSLSEFVETLRNRRSHRNLHDLTVLFRQHYPLPGLHYVGVALYLARYLATYLWKRALHLIAT